MSVAGDSVLDAIGDISPEGLVRPAKPATNFNEWQGDDKNDGLARAVYSPKRGLKVARRERTQSFDIRGNAAYIEKSARGK